jgi:hypothetical protein
MDIVTTSFDPINYCKKIGNLNDQEYSHIFTKYESVIFDDKFKFDRILSLQDNIVRYALFEKSNEVIKLLSHLRVVNCDSNFITSLDFSNNAYLTILSCNDNILSNLNLSSNITLSYLVKI